MSARFSFVCISDPHYNKFFLLEDPQIVKDHHIKLKLDLGDKTLDSLLHSATVTNGLYFYSNDEKLTDEYHDLKLDSMSYKHHTNCAELTYNFLLKSL